MAWEAMPESTARVPCPSATSLSLRWPPNVGTTTRANTKAPAPPSHWVIDRHHSNPTGSDSGSSTVSDVVVNPATDSNRASSTRSTSPEIR